MLIRDQIPSFPKLIGLVELWQMVAHGTTDRRKIAAKYYSVAEQEHAEELSWEKIVALLKEGRIRSTGRRSDFQQALWPVPGSEDTELGVLMEPEVDHGEAEVYTRVQA